MPEETVAVFLTATTCFSRHNFCHIAVLSVSFCCTDIQQQQVFFFHIQHLGHPIRRIPVGFRCFPLQPLTGIVFSKRDIPLKRILHDPVFTHRKFTVTSFHRPTLLPRASFRLCGFPWLPPHRYFYNRIKVPPSSSSDSEKILLPVRSLPSVPG